MENKLDNRLSKAKSWELTDHVHYHDVNVELNHVYLFGIDRGYEVTQDGSEPGVDFMLANRFIRNMNLCMRANPGKPILVHLKTCGGIWEEGMAIYDMIVTCASPVIILNYTHARSMSSIIFQAADKRVMMPHSHFMFHQGTYYYDGTFKNAISTLDFSKTNETVMLNIYVESMKKKGLFKGKPDKVIYNWLKDQMDKKEDVFLTAQETIQHGLADEIFNGDWKKLMVCKPRR